jgi:hypothetical protein
VQGQEAKKNKNGRVQRDEHAGKEVELRAQQTSNNQEEEEEPTTESVCQRGGSQELERHEH